MNTPSRIALGDVRNHIHVGTPAHLKEVSKTPSSIGLIQRPSASNVQPKFLDFDGGDHFEVFEEILSPEAKADVPEVKQEECKVVEEPIEKFDHCPESPDRFEDYLDQLRELEKIVLIDEFVSDDSYQPDFKVTDFLPSDFDEDLDLEKINIIWADDLPSDIDENPTSN